MDESYIELKCYIKYNLYYGQDAEKIKSALLNAGWPQEIIENAFIEVKKPAPFMPKPKKAVGKFVPVEAQKGTLTVPPMLPPMEDNKDGRTEADIPPPPQ